MHTRTPGDDDAATVGARQKQRQDSGRGKCRQRKSKEARAGLPPISSTKRGARRDGTARPVAASTGRKGHDVGRDSQPGTTSLYSFNLFVLVGATMRVLQRD